MSSNNLHPPSSTPSDIMDEIGDGESAKTKKNLQEGKDPPQKDASNKPPNQHLPKRGMKPRSKRNGKRARSEVHALGKDELSYQTTVRRLELDGVPISTSLSSSSVDWLRLVEPYPYTFSTYAKKRWEGRSVLDVYATEFGSYPRPYYESAILQGRILVSDRIVDPTYLIKGNDTLSHTVHRHEPGVAVHSPTEPNIRVLQETDEVLVVDKPGTLPVHPCGGYHIQSLMTMLEKYYDQKLYTIHRLDRLTSGLVILGKTSPVAQKWGKCIMDRDCQKVYLARVSGKFPLGCPRDLWLKNISVEERPFPSAQLPSHGEWKDNGSKQEQLQLPPQQLPSPSSFPKKKAAGITKSRKRNARVCWVTDETGKDLVEGVGPEQVFASQHSVEAWLQSLSKSEERDAPEEPPTSISPSTMAEKNMLWFHLSCPTRVANHKDGVCEAGSFHELEDDIYLKTVKPAQTSFGVVSYDPKTDSTVVICRPFTGRTHQIRLHLQHLGHSIANDPNYGGEIWYCNPEGREACKIAQERLDVVNVESTKVVDVDKCTTIGTVTASTGAIDVPATELEIEEAIAAAEQGPGENVHDFIRRTCIWCARCRAVGDVDRSILEFLIRSPGIWLHALQYRFTTAPDDDGDGDGANNKDGKQDANVHTYKAPLPVWHDF